MPLSIGDKLGHYEIAVPLGVGGMGEVYKARDTQLEREVAIKILPQALARDPERLARFDREAKILAALNHPNIAVIHGLVESDGGRALVMELVPGDTLGARIKRGAMPLEEALQVARQIAEALEAAHEKGVTHRDLKPSNVMITPTGLVKVLDFGLAAINQPAASADPNNSPTLTMGMTQAGAILGTASYMSPEQAGGEQVDKRADIWSLGVVLWEMLTGKRLFEGQTVSRTLAAVLQSPIDFDKLAAPAPVKKLLRRCLERDVRNRLRDTGEARFAIQEYLANPVSGTDSIVQAESLPHKKSWVGWAVAGAATLAAVALGAVHFRETAPVPQVVRFEVPAPEKGFVTTQPQLSPDGKMLAFSTVGADGRQLLWVRNLDTLEARSLTGTIGASNPVFWSPDSRSIAYSGGSIRKLMRVEVAGGPPQTLCGEGYGSNAPYGAWSPVGTVVLRGDDGLLKVPAAGGECTPVTRMDRKRGDQRHTMPAFLPDGRHFLYLRLTTKAESTGIYIGSLDAAPDQQDTARLLAADSGAVYTPSTTDPKTGFVLFRRENALMAQPFDPERRAFTGDAVAVAENVGGNADAGLFSASATGILATRTGNAGGNNQLTWYDRSGKVIGAVPGFGTYASLALSRDGTRVAFQDSQQQGSSDIWLYEFSRGTRDRLTFDPGSDQSPVWSPNGDRVIYSSGHDAVPNLYSKVSSNAGNEEPLLKSDLPKFPTSWSKDGRFLLYLVNDPKTLRDLWILPMTGGKDGGPGEPKRFLGTAAQESQGQFSPDGKYIAYASDATGRNQIYVRPFSPEGASIGQWMVSVDGGVEPRWGADGRELFFISADSKLMTVPLSTTSGFRPGSPMVLFPVPINGGGTNITAIRWDVAPDGKRFLFSTIAAAESSPPITVVLNWQAALRK
jgi:serine/threonine protein kinase